MAQDSVGREFSKANLGNEVRLDPVRIPGALVGGLLIGIVESMTGLFFGDSVGQLGIFLIFILVLLVRPTGLFGAKA